MDEHANPAGATEVPSGPPPYVGAPLAPPAGTPMAPSDPFMAPPGARGDYPQGWPPPPQAPRKRKVWPWVVSGVAALVVIGATAVGVIVFVSDKAMDQANPEYSAPEIGSTDEASAGNDLFISSSGLVAFETPENWENLTEQAGPLFESAGADDFASEDLQVWWAGELSDPNASAMVIFIEVSGPPILPGSVEAYHENFVEGFLLTFGNATLSEPETITNAAGLDMQVSHGRGTVEGVECTLELYSTGRGSHMVNIALVDYAGSGRTFPEVIDTLRIDK